VPMPPDFNQPAPMFAGGPGAAQISSPHVPATAPAVVAAVPPAPATQRSGGGKGLIIGLGAVGVVLLAAMAVVAARSSKSTANDPQTLTIPTPTTPTAANTAFAPLGTATTPSADTTPTATTPTPAGAGGSPAVKAQTGTASTGTGTGTHAAAGGAGSKPSGGGDACDACQSASIPVAASLVGRCADEAKKKACISRVKSSAPAAADAAIKNGKCGVALAIQQAADGIGAGSGKLNKTIKEGKCK